jgi:penicillin amidase
MYGYHLAGVAFPLLGHNRQYAYGLTMFENDDVDFYQEESNPKNTNQYKTAKGWKEYSSRTKTLNVKGEAAQTFTVKSSEHGPIMNDIIEGISQKQPLAMSWIYTKQPIKVLEAIYGISHANSMQEVAAGASKIHAPGLNVMYGDADDNIAWWASAKLYKFRDSLNPKFVLNGASGKDDPIRFLDFSENPQAINPTWNYVYSANNQPDSIAGMLYPGYYLPEDRAKRIVQLLAPKNDWTKEDFARMINDVTSSVAPKVVSRLTEVINSNDLSKNEAEAFDILQNWKGVHAAEAIGPTLYNKWVYLWLKNTYKDEMGEAIFNGLLNTHLMKRLIAEQIGNEESIWWDNIETEAKEDQATILITSFKQAVAALEIQLGHDIAQWQWGKVHTLEHAHTLGKVATLKPYFNVGPFAKDGSREVINNRGFDYDETGEYHIKSGPSTRRIIDFSDIENSISILPTGQSGNPFSPHYKDQVEMYNKGEFRKMLLNEIEIKSTAKSVLIFEKE